MRVLKKLWRWFFPKTYVMDFYFEKPITLEPGEKLEIKAPLENLENFTVKKKQI